MSSITGATASFQITIPNIFSNPVQLQGFGADDVFDTDEIESVQVKMGVDGHMAHGFIFVPIPQKITLMADSPTMYVFDQWWAANQAAEDDYVAQAIVWLKALGQKWVMTNGVLSRFKPTPAVKKLIQERTFTVTWESMSSAPV
jgi:hypothetical protein